MQYHVINSFTNFMIFTMFSCVAGSFFEINVDSCRENQLK
jgi:hypothetical protein